MTIQSITPFLNYPKKFTDVSCQDKEQEHTVNGSDAMKKGRNSFIEVFPVEGLGTSFGIVVNHCNRKSIVDNDGAQTNNGIKI